MTHYTEMPEAYPGQHRVIARTIENAERTRASEARHGGRYITGALARYLRPAAERGFPYGEHQARQALAGAEGADVVRNVWRHSLSPSGSTGTGRDTTAAYARSLTGGSYFGPRGVTLAAAESMFDWPIYRAAAFATVYGALWGQAGDAEERILATLAQCAGLDR